jgi:phosphomannomutase
MVTGSHIPDDRNGIKFNRADGEVLKPDETAIRAQSVALDEDLFDADGQLHAPGACPRPQAAQVYVARYVDFFGPQALASLTLGIYQHSAVGRDLLLDIVRQLGAKAVPLARSERFIPVDTEAVRPEDQALARQWAQDPGFDAILSTDGDSDRPLLADETGTWLRGDVLGMLCARALGLAAVATPVSSNSALERSHAFQAVTRTRIGSPFVIAAMNDLLARYGSACGYEANGGFILGSPVQAEGCELAALPTRDAVLPMIAVLAEARRQGSTLSGLVATLPQRFTASDRLQNYPTQRARPGCRFG